MLCHINKGKILRIKHAAIIQVIPVYGASELSYYPATQREQLLLCCCPHVSVACLEVLI